MWVTIKTVKASFDPFDMSNMSNKRSWKIMLCAQYRYIQCYVERVKTRDIHIFAHNFLNIQLIFNPKKVLESWDLGL